MIGGPMKLAVNEFLLRPDALEVVSGIVGAGVAGLGIREIWHHVGGGELNRAQRREMDMLDEAAPAGFFAKAVRSVHCSLIAREMRGGGAQPRVGWYHGLWQIKYLGHVWDTDPGFDAQAQAFDLTDIATPALDENGELA